MNRGGFVIAVTTKNRADLEDLAVRLIAGVRRIKLFIGGNDFSITTSEKSKN